MSPKNRETKTCRQSSLTVNVEATVSLFHVLFGQVLLDGFGSMAFLHKGQTKRQRDANTFRIGMYIHIIGLNDIDWSSCIIHKWIISYDNGLVGFRLYGDEYWLSDHRGSAIRRSSHDKRLTSGRRRCLFPVSVLLLPNNKQAHLSYR